MLASFPNLYVFSSMLFSSLHGLVSSKSSLAYWHWLWIVRAGCQLRGLRVGFFSCRSHIGYLGFHSLFGNLWYWGAKLGRFQPQTSHQSLTWHQFWRFSWICQHLLWQASQAHQWHRSHSLWTWIANRKYPHMFTAPSPKLSAIRL